MVFPLCSCPQNALRTLRTIEYYRSGSVLETHRAEQARNPEQVIGMIVSEENLSKAESHAESHHLALVPLSTVEQQRLALALNGQAGNVPLNGGCGCAGAEEGDA